MKDKRGIEMTTTTIIMIVLSIAVLAVLLIFLNSQTGFFSKWLKSQSSDTTVDPFIENCNSYIARESYYSYCCDKKEVKFMSGEDVENAKISCGEAQEYGWSKERLEYLDCLSTAC